MTEPELHLFAYGSNLDRDQMDERCPSARIAGPAVLPGHRLVFNRYSPAWRGGVADVVPDSSSEVWGLVWRIDPGEIGTLDRFEVVPRGYVRRVLTVRSRAGASLRAWTYQVTKKSEHVPPSARYLAIILRACEDHRFPASYRLGVEAAARGFKARQSPDL